MGKKIQKGKKKGRGKISNFILIWLKRPGEISRFKIFNPNLWKNKSYYMNFILYDLKRHITLIFMLKVHVVWLVFFISSGAKQQAWKKPDILAAGMPRFFDLSGSFLISQGNFCKKFKMPRYSQEKSLNCQGSSGVFPSLLSSKHFVLRDFSTSFVYTIPIRQTEKLKIPKIKMLTVFEIIKAKLTWLITQIRISHRR